MTAPGPDESTVPSPLAEEKIVAWLTAASRPLERSIYGIKSVNMHTIDGGVFVALTYIEDEYGNERNLVIQDEELEGLWHWVMTHD